MTCNPELDQDRAFDLYDTFDRLGCVMFSPQREVYEYISRLITGRCVLEAGCGNGVGTAILERNASEIVGTDKLTRNTQFAKELYPWIEFGVWDISKPYPGSKTYSSVVCIETIEHVADPKNAIDNLIIQACSFGGEVWISTPNGEGKPRPPANRYHVCEYTRKEMLSMIGDYNIEVVEMGPILTYWIKL